MKRIVAYLLVITTLVGAMIVPSVASTTTESGENEEPVIECPNGEHDIIAVEAKPATYTGVGWDAYEECSRCIYTTYKEIPTLPVPNITDYETFVMYLSLLEELANVYVGENPGKDPLGLIIKYIRTGVERYNSGSWGIMAGYEDLDFAKFAGEMEDMLNSSPDAPSPMLAICSLKNLKNFALPNGDNADLGHVFGSMDITYHNNFSVNHADVSGWAGDLVDLLEFADKGGVDSTTLEGMIEEVAKNYLGKTPSDPEQSAFNTTDIIGDLDAFYIMHNLQKMEYAAGDLTALVSTYFTEELTIEERADYFLRNRLNGASTRSEVREAVYNAYIHNKVVATLEGTREFQRKGESLENLRKACCYAFADYLCVLAGDYVEDPAKSYFEVFSAEKSNLAPGIKQEIKYATTADGKQTVFYVVTADVTRDDVHLFANYKDSDPSKGWGMQRVLDQANAAQAKYGDPESEHYIPNFNVIASTNGAGYNMTTGEPGGLLVMGGEEYHPIDGNGFFGVLDDGTVVIGTTEEYNTIYKNRVQEGIAGFGTILIKDGKINVPDSDSYFNDRASRTAAGITRTGKVVLMVMDGRQEPHSCGGSMQEIAQVLLEAGCVHAINLDGGGSTTYVAKPEGEEELRVVSRPSDGVSRSVSASLYIASTAPDSKAFDHAIVDSEFDYMTKGATMQMTKAGVSATGNSAEIPEGAYWQVVSANNAATITEDGLLTATVLIGEVDVNLMLGDQVLGTKKIEVVLPENVYFEKENINAVHGAKVVLPVKVLYENKAVAFTEADVSFSLSNAEAGTIDGFTLTVATGTNVKRVSVIAALTSDSTSESPRTSTINISIYAQGENTFDFDQAVGGNRQLAWDRQVSNATTEDQQFYTVVESGESMVTSYTLALDMTHIPIPKQLEDLTYMLPGSDMEGASAWTFLCQLAERVSVLTVVTPTVQFDPNMDVDVSGITLINEYFFIDKEKDVHLDKETNTLTLTLHWRDQTHAIDVSTANPLCIVNGIKLTPKSDAAWNDQNRLNVANVGEISYCIYLRANALYTFAGKPENQEVFGLYQYQHPDTVTWPNDKGGYFESVYAKFEDSYTLVNSPKNGWINEGDGFSYQINGEKLYGIQKIGDLYYDLGENGINVGKTPYTGIFEMNGDNYYARNGQLLVNGWYRFGDVDYHSHADKTVHLAICHNPIDCTHGGYISYTCTECGITEKAGSLILPTGHDWDDNYVCRIPSCGAKGTNIADAVRIAFGPVNNPYSAHIFDPGFKPLNYYFASGGMRPLTHVTFDGTTALSASSDNNPDMSDYSMLDLFVSWTNPKVIGKAYVNISGRGNYYGEVQLPYFIVPADVKNIQATEVTRDSITWTWGASAGAGYYYVQYGVNGTWGAETKVYGASYTANDLAADTEYQFRVRPSAISTDGEEKQYNGYWSSVLTARTEPMPYSSEVIWESTAVVGGAEVQMQSIGNAEDMFYFFLPTTADLSNFRLVLNISEPDDTKVVVNGITTTVAACREGIILNLMTRTTAINVQVGDYRNITIQVQQSSNIPSMFITSDHALMNRDYVDASKDNETTAQMTLVDANGVELYNGALKQIKMRGNSTTGYPKKSYQIKLDTKTDLLGQNEKVGTWVLLANYGDATMMHDKFFKDLAAQMGMPYVASCDWVNLWYDGEYRGVYLLSEKNSVGSTSVDITDMEAAYEELNPTYGENMQVATGTNKYGQSFAYTAGLNDPADITGGYLIELNHEAWDEVNGFKTAKGKGFNVKSPEWASEAAMKYVSEYYQEFEDAVYATDAKGNYTGYNATTGKYFYDYVDMDSLVKVFLMNELGVNPDGFISSMYFYKDANGKMYAGPVWDQDMTLGTGWGWYLAPDKNYTRPYLAEALIKIPAFKARVCEYFAAEFAPIVKATLAEGGKIDGYYALLAENAEMNYDLWPYVRAGKPTADDHIWENANYEIVVNDMISWLSTRVTLLETTYAPQYALGDANHDGKVNSSDAVLILRYAAKYVDEEFYVESADYNGDGKVNSTDAVLVLRKAAKLDD